MYVSYNVDLRLTLHHERHAATSTCCKKRKVQFYLYVADDIADHQVRRQRHHLIDRCMD
jgi:hypothetical protein